MGCYALIPCQNKRYFWHIGITLSDRNPTGEQIRYCQRPENHLFAIGPIDAKLTGQTHQGLYGLESAWLTGVLRVQGEYIMAQR